MKILRIYVDTKKQSKLCAAYIVMFKKLEQGIKGLKVKVIHIGFLRFEGGNLIRKFADS